MQKKKVINVKLEPETKDKITTLAYLKNIKLNDLCVELIEKAINDNADAINKTEKIRAEYKDKT